MLHVIPGEHPLSRWVKIALCAWMGAVTLLFIILFWPPSLWGLAEALGILDKLRLIQQWITPFFTANYLS